MAEKTQPKSKVVKPKPAAVEPKEEKWVIAENKSATSLKGILAPGSTVKAEYFASGKDAFDALINKGVIVKG